MSGLKEKETKKKEKQINEINKAVWIDIEIGYTEKELEKDIEEEEKRRS